MKDLWSDAKINVRLTELLNVDVMAIAQDGLIVDGKSASVDYCNSWSDMGPLIVEHDICLNHANSCTKEAFIRDKFGFVCFTGEHRVNVLRAAAICLIKKLEAENA